MELKDVQRSNIDGKMIAGKVNLDIHKYIKDKNILVGKLIEEAVKELREKE